MRLYDYPASGNCLKVRLLLALTGAPYERVPVDIFAGDTLTDAYGRINPVRETPVLELDTGDVIAQSNAILWYLAEGTAFLPSSRLERGLVAQWLSFEQERVMTGIGGTRFRRLTGRAALDPAADAARFARGLHALGLLDDHLDGRDFFVGSSCSIADLSLFGYTHVAADAGFQIEDFPAVCGWLARIAALPGYVNDLEPYPANAGPGTGQSIYE